MQRVECVSQLWNHSVRPKALRDGTIVLAHWTLERCDDNHVGISLNLLWILYISRVKVDLAPFADALWLRVVAIHAVALNTFCRQESRSRQSFS